MYEYAKTHGFITNEDQYLDSITERQDLCLNMTQMSDEEVKMHIADGAENLNKKLKLGLSNDTLIRTGGYNNHTKDKKLKKLKREKNSLILNYSEAEFSSNLGITQKNV